MRPTKISFTPQLCLFLAVLFLLLFYVTEWTSPDILNALKTAPKKKVLFAVPILIESVERRQAIRDTWGNFSAWPSCEIDFTLKFFVGNPVSENQKRVLEEETLKFKDMVRLDLKESYYALTNKTVKMFTHIVNLNSMSDEPFDYVIKTDDDTFVNIPVLCREFALLPKKEVYGGQCHLASQPYRADSRVYNPKLVLSLEEYPGRRFPPHCEGPFYYLSKDMVELLVKGFETSQLIKFEDVSVGIVLNSVVPDLHKKLKLKTWKYHYLPSYEKSKGLEIQYGRGVLSSKWAFHPVVTFGRMYHMQKLTLEVNSLKGPLFSLF